MLKKYKFFLISSIIFILSTIFWWHFFGVFNLGNDGLQYHELALSMLNDGGFKLDGEYSMMREPAYPFFIFLVYKLFGVSLFAVAIFQVIMHAAIILIAYYLANKIFNERIAKLSMGLLILFPMFYIYTSAPLSEIFACLLAMLFFLFFYLAEQKGNYIFFAIAGLFLGGLVLTKAMFFLFIVFPLLLLFANGIKSAKGFDFKKPLIMLFFFALVILPWMARNYSHFKEFTIASRGGNMIYTRALKNSYSLDKAAKYSLSILSGEYIVRRFIDNDYVFEDSWIDTAELNAFAKNIKNSNKLNNYDKLDVLMGQEAKRLLLEHPFKFLYFGMVEIISLNSPMIYQEKHFSMFHDNIYHNTFLKTLSIIIFRTVWAIFLFFMIYGAIRTCKEKKEKAYVFLAIILYVNMVLFFLQGNPRFLMPIFPFYLIFAVYGIFKAAEKTDLQIKFSRMIYEYLLFRKL